MGELKGMFICMFFCSKAYKNEGSFFIKQKNIITFFKNLKNYCGYDFIFKKVFIKTRSVIYIRLYVFNIMDIKKFHMNGCAVSLSYNFVLKKCPIYSFFTIS